MVGEVQPVNYFSYFEIKTVRKQQKINADPTLFKKMGMSRVISRR